MINLSYAADDEGRQVRFGAEKLKQNIRKFICGSLVSEIIEMGDSRVLLHREGEKLCGCAYSAQLWKCSPQRAVAELRTSPVRRRVCCVPYYRKIW